MRLPGKTEGALISQYWLYIFYHSRFLSNVRLPWKTELPRNVSLYGIYFLHSEYLSNLHALSLKNRVALIFFTVFEHVFLSFRIFEQLALALKNRVALEFFTVLKYILLFRIFEQLAVALKFFKPGRAAAPSPTPCLVRLCRVFTLKLSKETRACESGKRCFFTTFSQWLYRWECWRSWTCITEESPKEKSKAEELNDILCQPEDQHLNRLQENVLTHIKKEMTFYEATKECPEVLKS